MIRLLLDYLYPPRCAFCRRLLTPGIALCLCPDCAARYDRRDPATVRRDIRHVALAVAPLRYEGAVRESLLRYKFGGATSYGAVYADFLAKCIDENRISCDSITWVPLSKRRLRQRGYDQARILAEELAKRMGLPCRPLLKKTRHTRAQSSLNAADQRRANASGAYVCADAASAAGRRILLVDDIITTGATVSECAKVLRAAGCRSVIAASAAMRA